MPSRTKRLLAAADLALLAAITWIGLQFHETASLGPSRFAATWIPFSAAWLVLAAHLGAYNSEHVTLPGQLWRPLWAMVLAAPMAGFLRALWLESTVVPIFVILMGGLSALVLTLWRTGYIFLGRWTKSH
jgi:hypothetical protein